MEEFFKKIYELIKKLGIVGQIAFLFIGPAMIATGLRVWRLLEKETTVSKLLDDNISNPIVGTGFLLFVISIASLIARSKRIALSDWDFVERIEDGIGKLAAQELKWIIASRAIGVPISEMLKTTVHDFIDWAKREEKIETDCASKVKQAWNEYLENIGR